MKHKLQNLENALLDSIGNQFIFAYLNILQDSCDFETGEIKLDFKDSNICEIVEYIKNFVIDTDKILSSDTEQSLIEQIKHYRAIIISKYKVINAYSNQYTIFLYFLEEYMLKKHSSKNHTWNSSELEYFYNNCHNFIESFEDNDRDRIITMQQFLKSIPFSITEDKYFEYLNKSLQLELKNQKQLAIDRFIDILKQEFNPTSVEGYGKIFSEILYDLKEYSQILKSNFEFDEDDLKSKLYILNERILDISNLLSIIYSDLNYILIALFSGLDAEFIARFNISYMDLYKTACLILDKNTSDTDKNIYSDTLSNLLNQNIESVMEIQADTEAEIERLTNSYDIVEDSKIDDFLTKHRILKFYLDNRLEQTLYLLKDSPIANREYIQNSIDGFIEFLKGSIKNMDIREKNLHMQNLLGSILPIWNEHEILEYMKFSLDNCSNVEMKSMAISEITEIMEDAGFL